MTTLIQAKEIINSGLVRAAPLDVRFDALLLSPHISFAESRFIKPLISSKLYEAMKAEKGNTISNYNPNYGAIQIAFDTTAAYEKLWTEHLLSFLSQAVLYQALPFLTQQITSQGAMINDTEFSKNSGVQGAKYLQDTILQTIEFQKDEIKEYLFTNKDNFTALPSSFFGDECENKDASTSKKLGLIFY